MLSADSFRTNAGIGQLVPWGGGRYTLGLDAARATTSNPTGLFNPQLDSGLAASYTQPLLRNFKFDSFRQNVAVSLKKRGDCRPAVAAVGDADVEPGAELRTSTW